MKQKDWISSVEEAFGLRLNVSIIKKLNELI